MIFNSNTEYIIPKKTYKAPTGSKEIIKSLDASIYGKTQPETTYVFSKKDIKEYITSEFSSSTRETKIQMSNEIPKIFSKLRIPIKGKKVLDVGSGYGFNAKKMTELGAKVFGIEPNLEAANISIIEGNFKPKNILKMSVQNIPERFNKIFDLVTVFLYNIPFTERNEVMEKLTRLIKPEGKVIVSLMDDVYIDGLSAVKSHARLFFNKVFYHSGDNYIYKEILELSKPKIYY